MYVRGVCAVCYISMIQSYCFQYKRCVVVVVNGISDSYRGHTGADLEHSSSNPARYDLVDIDRDIDIAGACSEIAE